MEFKGTKGKWRNDKSQFYENKMVILSDFKCITHINISSLEDKANAKLIAAAPELLEALIEFLKQYKENVDSGDWGNWKAEDQPEYQKAIAAIEKATL